MLFPSRLALHLLVLQCMTTTLDEIATHRARLREEIMERECLLAALGVFEKYAASGHTPRSMEFGSLVSALLPPMSTASAPERAALPAPAPPALPPPPPAAPVKHYVHPELHALLNRHGVNGLAVRWAIQRMTDDYTPRDLGALLQREGWIMSSAEISVVMTRLKRRGAVEEIRSGQGRTPAVFRKPTTACAGESDPAQQTFAVAS